MKKILGYFTALILLTSCQSSNEPELHIFIWSDYIKPELIERFKQECNCQVIIDTYDSNESMYAKLNLGSGGYDLIVPSSYFMDLMIRQQMLQPIDRAKIPNLKNLDPKYLEFADVETLNYGVPYMVSIGGVAFRKDKVKDFEPTWGIFGRSEYKGRMTMMNDLREALGVSLRYLGYNSNTTHPEEIDKAADQLIKWKKNLAKFDAEQYKAGIASAEYVIVQGYNGDIMQVIQENPNVDFVYPKEGVLISMDLMAIPANASNQELAHKFINFLLQADVAAENIENTFFLSPNQEAYKLLPKELRESPILFPPQEVLDKMELTRDVGDARVLYNQAWEKVKRS